jgi:L-histidine Nalpha-methyltransferase
MSAHVEGALGAPSRESALLMADARVGLGGPGQKWLPVRWLYDEVGSALFEAIAYLPEYGLTRADERILRSHARALAARLSRGVMVAELGSGSGRKTRWVLEALARQSAVRYHPIDVSAAALARCRVELGEVARVEIATHESDYLEGLSAVAGERGDEDLLVLFVGSTIGNFERAAADDFLAAVRGVLRPGDALLLGTDLVKEVPRMLAAYDDAAGVTAAFNRNLLVRINRELLADFDPRRFDHEVRWDAGSRRIEMHLRSRGAQRIAIRAAELEIRFRDGETIWTESSHKYRPDEPAKLALRAGFRCAAQWSDAEWPFAESLLVAV